MPVNPNSPLLSGIEYSRVRKFTRDTLCVIFMYAFPWDFCTIAILANLLDVESHKLISQIRFCRRSSMPIPINCIHLFQTYTRNIHSDTEPREDLFTLPILFSRTFSPSLAKLLIPSFSNYTGSPILSVPPYSHSSCRPLHFSHSLSRLFVSENIQFGR